MDKIAIGALRIGLENSYWYSDDDEKVFNELVKKAEAFDEIKDYLSRPSPIDEDRDEVQKIIDEYDKKGAMNKMKYRKKPEVVEAFRFYIDPMPDWFMDKVSTNEVTLPRLDYERYRISKDCCEIKTLGVVMTASVGDYIVKGVQGEIYPCKPCIFEATFEKLEGE